MLKSSMSRDTMAKYIVCNVTVLPTGETEALRDENCFSRDKACSSQGSRLRIHSENLRPDQGPGKVTARHNE